MTKAFCLFSAMLVTSLFAHAIDMKQPKANAVLSSSKALIEVSGACQVGYPVKVVATDSANVSTGLVWTPCQSAAYYATPFDISKMKMGVLKLKAFQTIRNRDVAVTVSVVKGSVTTPTVPTTPTTPSTAVIKLMPLGDSITHGYTVSGGYRGLLEDLIVSGVAQKVDFVGTQNDGPASLSDKDHQGHPGIRSDQINDSMEMILSANVPDVVLLDIGANDILQAFQLSSAPARVMSIVDKLRSKNPNVKVFVANLFPISGNAIMNANLAAFNASLAALVNARTNAGQKVYLVDMNSGFNAQRDTSDAVHPTQSAYDEMARRWFNALLAH